MDTQRSFPIEMLVEAVKAQSAGRLPIELIGPYQGVMVNNIGTLSHAKPNEVAFLANPKFIDEIPGVDGAIFMSLLGMEAGRALCDILSGTKTRLVVVGGAGSLYVNPEHTAVVSDSPDFPPQFLPLAKAQGKALEELRKRNDVQWTFISPAGDFQADGERTGEYILAGEELTLNSRGESIISYADYAIAMIDEIINGNHIQQRISVVRK